VQDLCLTRLPSCWGAWNGGAVQRRTEARDPDGSDDTRSKPVGGRAPSRAIAGAGLQVAPVGQLGVIGVPGASERPSFVAVEIAKDVPPLPAPIPGDNPASVNDAPRRRRRKKVGLSEIELEGGRRVRVDRDVDAAALKRLLDLLARR
jgi:hypothetical protein